MRGCSSRTVLDKFSRANTPHPSATLPPQGEGLSLTKIQQNNP
ncbi:MAG: hypothetical protein ACI4RP_03435 [Acutalibacteraceae bacterium]